MLNIMISLILLVRLSESQCSNNVETTPQRRDRRAGGELNKLKVVNYNAEWLYTYDTSTDGSNTKCKEWDKLAAGYKTSDFPVWGKVAKGDDLSKLKRESNHHIENIKTYLDILDADIFVFEEICDCATLEKLRQKLTKQAKYKSYYIENTHKHQQLGIITKIDPVPDGSNKAKFELLEVGITGRPKGFRTEFDIGKNGKKLVLYAIHLTASETSVTEREAEATHINTKIDADKRAGHYVLLTGDFNTDTHFRHRTDHKQQLPGNNRINRAWIAEYESDRKIKRAEFADDARGIQITNVGGLAQLPQNSIIRSVKYEIKQDQVPDDKGKPNSVAAMDVIMRAALPNAQLVQIEITCGAKTVKLKKLKKAAQVRARTQIWITDKKYLDCKFEDDPHGSPTQVKVTKQGPKSPCADGSIVENIKVITQPGNIITTADPKTKDELLNLVTNTIKPQADLNKLVEVVITSQSKRAETTLTVFKTHLQQLNEDNTQSADEKYSHRSCGSAKYSTFDYFYASDNLKGLIDGQMKYEHSGGHKASNPDSEKVCNGYSDHCPISVTFTTSHGDFQYAKRTYDNYYDAYQTHGAHQLSQSHHSHRLHKSPKSQYFHELDQITDRTHSQQAENLIFFGFIMIFSTFCICCVIASGAIGTVCGYFAAKAHEKKHAFSV